MNNTFVPRALAVTLAASALAAFACDRDATRTDATATATPANREGGVGTTPMTNKATVSNDQAIQNLVNARCEREARCNNVGPGKQWASAEACRSDLTAKNRDELKASECPGGIVQKELDECLADVRKETCDSPLDTLTRLAACRSSDLCKATGM